MLIRRETSADHATVGQVHRRAFATRPGYEPIEHLLLAALRSVGVLAERTSRMELAGRAG